LDNLKSVADYNAGRTFSGSEIVAILAANPSRSHASSKRFDFEGRGKFANEPVVPGEVSRCAVLRDRPDSCRNMALQQGKYSEAVEHFTRIQNLDEHAKFFMNWEWRMTAQLELSNACFSPRTSQKRATAADAF